MPREHQENAALMSWIPDFLRGEMAVVANPDPSDDDLDEEMPDTTPETRRLEPQAERLDRLDRERAAGEGMAPPSSA